MLEKKENREEKKLKVMVTFKKVFITKRFSA